MTLIEEAIISGFIGEAISRCTDISWTKMKEAAKNRKNKHQSIESQIYNVIVNVLNQITYNEFENDQNKIYQSAEKLLIGYKDDGYDQIEVVRSGLQILGESVNHHKYMEFKTLLYQELCKDDYKELYRQIRLLQQDEESSKTLRIERKVDKLQRSADETNRRLDALQENSKRSNIQNDEPVKSSTQEYADKWNKNMFLNDFDDWDENAGINVKLHEVYRDEHLPHFIWGENKKESDNLDKFLYSYIENNSNNKMLLILGQPGIGKSTLITWITVKFSNRINDILVYKFTPDLENIDWRTGRISNKVLERLCLNYDDLNRKVLIIDGFDEVSIEPNRRRDILDNLYGDWILNKSINNFTLIITCRENYVQKFAILRLRYITLLPWDEGQMVSFCSTFKTKTGYDISHDAIKKLVENKSILGIPLILYMVLALNISIEKEGSIVDVYDKIFSLEGGIYDRCIGYGEPHRIRRIKTQIHEISKRIAMWMFENNPEETYITQREYQNICVDVMQKQDHKNGNLEQDFMIGNFFKLVKHCEGIETEKLYFVHRSIYEYFVAETIFASIKDILIKLSDNYQENFGNNFTKCFNRGNMNNTAIRTYLKYKLQKFYDKLEVKDKHYFYQWWEKTISKMMKCGMFLNVNNNFQNFMKEVTICFMNLMEVLRIVVEIDQTCKTKYICQYIERDVLEKYIKYCLLEYNKEDFEKIEYFNFQRMNLEGMNFRGMDFNYADLKNAKLKHTNLMGANLYNAYLDEVDLSDSCLMGAILNMEHLNEAVFSKNQIEELERYYVSRK